MHTHLHTCMYTHTPPYSVCSAAYSLPLRLDSITSSHMDATMAAVLELSMPPLRGRKNPAILLLRR